MTLQTADIDCLNSGDILQDCVGDFCIVSLGFNQSSRVNRLVYLCGYTIERSSASILLEYCNDNTIHTADGFIVAAVNPYASSFDNGEHLANQRLLAAAPELLAALETALELGAYRGDRMPIKAVKPIFDAMKAAIAKAKGETL